MKKYRVLVVDDEPGIRQSLTGVLEDEGFEVSSVEKAEDGLDAIHHHSYDVVLMDIWLPNMDGLEALQRIQEIPLEDRPTVVMISGHGNIETAVRATKPASIKAMRTATGSQALPMLPWSSRSRMHSLGFAGS